jgi:hypothetical protein
LIDPKLDKLQGKTSATPQPNSENEKLLHEKGQAARNPRPGLSINDTIAADSNLSVGSRGVDVSGVETGAGAGAGLTSTTPAAGGSPAPTIVPGARGSGMTPRSTSALTERHTVDLGGQNATPEQSEIAARAYRCWHDRGCPDGSPELDWDQAERELREERRTGKAAAAGT